MSLTNGTYEIKSTMTKHTIGRNLIENRSLLPKDIIVQSGPGLQHGLEHVLPNTHWEVERSGKGYCLRTGGATAGLLDGGDSRQIVALLQENLGGSSREWILRPVAAGTTDLGEGDDIYNICDSERSNLVWTIKVDDENAPQGDIKQILVLEPFEGSNLKQVFNFVKVVNEEGK